MSNINISYTNGSTPTINIYNTGNAPITLNISYSAESPEQTAPQGVAREGDFREREPNSEVPASGHGGGRQSATHENVSRTTDPHVNMEFAMMRYIQGLHDAYSDLEDLLCFPSTSSSSLVGEGSEPESRDADHMHTDYNVSLPPSPTWQPPSPVQAAGRYLLRGHQLEDTGHLGSVVMRPLISSSHVHAQFASPVAEDNYNFPSFSNNNLPVRVETLAPSADPRQWGEMRTLPMYCDPATGRMYHSFVPSTYYDLFEETRESHRWHA
ncbi:hypothetical protein Clacol_003426 [Clathrus columnatus]|uniref:Uncharacterized protein n=1 Tax=Clathrus columnatus TaxID=1419009 RepID=A0AAV5A8Y7_9AGAM|nr:hypothetical protein Clacol_003426 [Clathrus columnatus]